jgi:hypothetical protein
MSYIFLLDAGVESSAECFSGIPACVLSRSSCTVDGHCCKGKGMECSHGSQSGTTCERSTGGHGGDGRISWREDSPARISRQRTAREKESTVSGADCGGRWPGWFARWDPGSCSWKTRQCSLLEGLDGFSETWPRWGTMRSGECSLRPMPFFLSATRLYITTVIEFLSSGIKCPTPNVPNGGRRVSKDCEVGASGLTAYLSGRKQQVGLEQWVQWGVKVPTPRSTDWKGGGYQRKGENWYPSLPGWVGAAKVPTPTVMNKTGGQALCKWGGQGARRKLREVFTEKEINGPLNPEWVEWLMGWPIGMSGLQRLEMDRFRQWCDSHGRCFRDE